MNYVFEPARKDDFKEIFTLYADRICWMDAHGIKQWNVVKYLELYPLSYYRKQCELGNLFVFRYVKSGLLAGAVVLKHDDGRWPDKAGIPAYYIHNLATRTNVKGVGTLIIKEIEKLAIEHGKHFVCLDCAADNVFLNQYYASKGYREAGNFIDGRYSGIRREKEFSITAKSGPAMSEQERQ